MVEPPELSSWPEISDWQCAADGDRERLAGILRSVQDPIFRYCLSQLKDAEQATEATQETATRMIRNLGQFAGKSQLSTWILGIARNVCREQKRKLHRWNQSTEAEPHVECSNEHKLVQQESNARLRKAVNELPSRQREAIALRFFESLSVAEIAKVMSVSTGTVKATLNNAIKKLKSRLVEFE